MHHKLPGSFTVFVVEFFDRNVWCNLHHQAYTLWTLIFVNIHSLWVYDPWNVLIWLFHLLIRNCAELNIDTAITPLPLINGPPRQDVVSGRLATTSTSQKNLYRSPNQSSSPHSVAPLNDLQVDERRFLNEIVKNFNKSIVGNAIEFLPAAPGQNSATAVNESYSSPHGQIPKQEHAVVPHEANRNTNTTNSSSTMPGMATVPQLNGHRSHPKSGVGVNAVGPKSGSTKTYEHKSDSAMLNYLFDSFVKHRHSDRRYATPEQNTVKLRIEW